MFQWYQENYFKGNVDKYHSFLTIANYNIASTISEELLEVVISSEVTFANHDENLCRKTIRKLHLLARVAILMTSKKRRLVMKIFVFSQFFQERSLRRTQI